MDYFTTRPSEAWTGQGTQYTHGTSSRSFSSNWSGSTSEAEPYSADSDGTTFGRTYVNAFGQSGSSNITNEIGKTGLAFGQTTFYSEYNSAQSITADSSTSDESNWSNTSSRGFTTATRTTAGDTYAASSTARSSKVENGQTFNGDITENTGSISQTNGTLFQSTRTSLGTKSTVAGTTNSFLNSTSTEGLSDGLLGVFTTIPIGAGWGTTYTEVSGVATTSTTDTEGEITYIGQTTSSITGSSHSRTSYIFENMLQDSVFLMKKDRTPDDYNRGELLWSFTDTTLAVGSSKTGLFTDFYASSSADEITVNDYRKFHTFSLAISQISISLESASSTSGTDTSFYTITKSNGSTFATSETRTTSHTSQATTVALTSNLTTSYSASFSLGAVSSTISTWTVETATDTNQPASTVSSTIFTHSHYLSGYSISSGAGTASTRTWVAGFTTGTTSSLWGYSSSFSSSRMKLYSSAESTVGLSTRATTLDTILISSFTTVGSGAYTQQVFLGSVSTTTSRWSSVASTATAATYLSNLHITGDSYTSSGESFRATFRDNFALSAHTQYKVFPYVFGQPPHDNLPPLNSVMHKCHMNGYAGFGGVFTVSDLVVGITTSQGLQAGNQFTIATLTPPTQTAEACKGVTFYAAGTNVKIGGLGEAYSTSMISVPTKIESVLSIGATWTSTYISGTSTSTSSRYATHTIGAVSTLSDDFWSFAEFTVNSNFRNGSPGPMSGGFVAGDNALGETYRVFARVGHVKWTEFSSTQSTAGVVNSTQSTGGSVSFTIPANKAIVFSLEPILTASWSAVGQYSIFSSGPHLSYSPPE